MSPFVPPSWRGVSRQAHVARICSRVVVGVGALLLAGALRTAGAQTAGRPSRVAIGVLQRTADSLRTAGADPRAVAAAYLTLGDAFDANGDSALLGAYEQSAAFSERAADSLALANALQKVGIAHWRANRYDSALTVFARVRGLRVALGDRDGLARVANSIGATYYQLGIYEQALEAFLESLQLRRELGDTAGLARSLTNVGKTYQDWRQFARAEKVLQEAVDAARKAKSPLAIGYALTSLAMLEMDLGQLDRARDLIAQSMAAYATPGALTTRADSLDAYTANASARAMLALRRGQPRLALQILDSVYAIGADRGSVRGQARTYLSLGQAHATIGATAQARSEFEQALTLARSVSQRVMALDALRQLADLEERAGNSAVALRHLRAYQVLSDTIFNEAAAQRIASMETRAESERTARRNFALEERQREQAAIISRQRLVGGLGALILLLSVSLAVVLVRFNRRDRVRLEALSRTNQHLEAANQKLGVALSEVRTLSGLIPICSSCKRIRDDSGYWNSVESYLASHSDVTFSHSICQSCGPELYGELWPK